MNIKRFVAVIVVFFLGIGALGLQDQDISTHSVAIRLYAKVENEGNRNKKYRPILVDGNPGYLIFNTQETFGVKEVGRSDLLQAPEWSKEDGVRVGWPTGSFVIAKVTETEWQEDRPDGNSGKKAVSFHDIKIVLESNSSEDPITIYGTDHDNPKKLPIKKSWILLGHEDAQKLCDFVKTGTPVTIMLDVPAPVAFAAGFFCNI